MKGRQAAIVLGAFLGALGTQGLSAGDNDRAVPRGGGSSGGGGGHHSGGGSSSAGAHHSSGSSNGGSSSSNSGASARTPRTDAQRRHPQPGTGSGYRHHGYYGGGYYGNYYSSYYPYYSYWPYNDFYWGYGFYSPWYSGFYGGYGPAYGYGGYGPAYGYGGGYHRAYYDRSGSVRVIVEPNQTKVYVDNYYAGTADDFDGIFQRLNLTPGRHDIALKLEGYETHKVKLYVPLDHTLKIKHEMVKGAADRVTESSVGDPADEERYARRADDDMDDRRYEPRDRAPQDREPDDRAEPQERRDDSWPASRERGTLRLEVRPLDASIYVDGMFRGTGDDLRRLSLPAGRHRLEIVRPGYRTLERDVEVQAGETEEVDVELPRS